MNENNKISITPVKKRDIQDIVRLQKEFESYLQGLSGKPRKKFSAKATTTRLLKDGFGKERAFQGFIAKKENKPLGYILFHPGYDPDEMRGRVVYVIDIFITKNARGLGIGSLLMKKVAEVCRKNEGTEVYFGVWIKNKKAIKFYEKLGAKFARELPFMYWSKNEW